MNFKKHGVDARAVDRCSSGPWFTGWRDRPSVMSPRRVEAPVAAARTWLLRVGWMRYGLVALDEAPRAGYPTAIHERDMSQKRDV